MSTLNASIGGIVAGDDLDVRRTVTGIPAGQTLAKAWLTFQATPGGADPGLLQKVITTSAVIGVGQITDDGADGTGEVLFQLTGADTLALPVECSTPYDIKVKTSAGKIYTAEQGKYLSARRVTQATS
jgi:hypothetical protein